MQILFNFYVRLSVYRKVMHDQKHGAYAPCADMYDDLYGSYLRDPGTRSVVERAVQDSQYLCTPRLVKQCLVYTHMLCIKALEQAPAGDLEALAVQCHAAWMISLLENASSIDDLDQVSVPSDTVSMDVQLDAMLMQQQSFSRIRAAALEFPAGDPLIELTC